MEVLLDEGDCTCSNVASSRSALHGRKEVLNAIRCAIAWAVLGGTFAALAQNTSFPDRPIRFVVAFVPGGATDTLTRQLTEEFHDCWGSQSWWRTGRARTDTSPGIMWPPPI